MHGKQGGGACGRRIAADAAGCSEEKSGEARVARRRRLRTAFYGGAAKGSSHSKEIPGIAAHTHRPDHAGKKDRSAHGRWKRAPAANWGLGSLPRMIEEIEGGVKVGGAREKSGGENNRGC